MADQGPMQNSVKWTHRHLLYATVSWLTLLLSLATFVVAAIWFLTDWSNLEPLCTLLGVSAAICGLIFDPLIQRRDLRQDIIEAVKVELSCNQATITNSSQSWDEALTQGAVSYGRLTCSAIERALSSGDFTTADGDLYLMMLEVRANILATNAAISQIECLMLFKHTIEERKDAHNRLVIAGNMVHSKARLDALSSAIAQASF